MNRTTPSKYDEYPELEPHGLASVTLSAHWADDLVVHEEQLHVEKFSVWREADTLPPEIGQNLVGIRANDELQANVKAGEVVASWVSDRQISTKPACFDRHHRQGLEVTPRLGRFYPQGFFKGVQGIYSEAVEPARIIELSGDRMRIDLNQPLARFPLQLKFHLDEVLSGYDRRGGRCASPLDNLLQFPGLAAPLRDGQDTDYGDDSDGMSRMDERSDDSFYANPRMVQHLDTKALQTINSLYRRLIPPQSEVLDLMASFDSHLQGTELANIHLLGMNAKELSANQSASNSTLQDLNKSPTLPFENNSLDAIISTASIEYLCRPTEVLTEALRVLRPGGITVISFSNRWFPTKAIRVWSELHMFERIGMVSQWLQRAGYTRMHTFSSRGWPRPADDTHAGQTPYSDPVFAVWGFKP
ncbi:MAG: methyltransferase domain-containing protein [Candidatus Thiodiazotropha sp. 6PLUC2]